MEISLLEKNNKIKTYNSINNVEEGRIRIEREKNPRERLFFIFEWFLAFYLSLYSFILIVFGVSFYLSNNRNLYYFAETLSWTLFLDVLVCFTHLIIFSWNTFLKTGKKEIIDCNAICIRMFPFLILQGGLIVMYIGIINKFYYTEIKDMTKWYQHDDKVKLENDLDTLVYTNVYVVLITVVSFYLFYFIFCVHIRF